MSAFQSIFELIQVLAKGSFCEFQGVDYDVFAVESHILLMSLS